MLHWSQPKCADCLLRSRGVSADSRKTLRRGYPVRLTRSPIAGLTAEAHGWIRLGPWRLGMSDSR